ncbi:class I SAM-dependent methyltransferase [Aurantibacillus circumpalustris]|uniref:class I SAM-dependent methyltransferase n=1 Tax=Aurantibacillus circumpalustris TaxID=3036359 RepID=UPI00295B574B|nr:class I SAM-dependent methyltransferase [Aurantibacillus circumpalustris]
MDFFTTDTRNALEAKEYAQWIAFAPMVFQASRILRNNGILKHVEKSRRTGITIEELVKEVNLPLYNVRVLLEAGLGIGLVYIQDEKYFLTKTGYFILNDELTRVNLDFTNDVCYQGMWDLDKSLEQSKPEGLKVFGKWGTIYEGLSTFPEPAKKSWFDFDHYYSDNAFDEVLSHVLDQKPKKILDIGGNTGKWSIACANYCKDVHMTIMDLPGQTNMARKNIESKGLSDRIGFYEANILDEKTVFPKGFDGVWMSQFLDCFSDEEIISILKRCANAIDENGYIYILETFWDKQRFGASAFCLQMTSLYFTAMANGNSQMYDSKVFLKLVKQSGLEVVEQVDNIGVSHSLLKCKKIK